MLLHDIECRRQSLMEENFQRITDKEKDEDGLIVL